MRYNSSNGSINETMILQALDNHRFKDLDQNWKKHIKRMFKEIKDNDVVTCNYYPYKDAKPDLEIIVNNRRLYLSIKSGHSPCVHQEPIATFMEFLRSFDVPEYIIDLMLFYHYGYSPKYRAENRILSREEIVTRYPGLIRKVNDYFNTHLEIVRQVIYRSIIRGRLKRDLIDYLYYGNPAKGYLLSVYNIVDLIVKDLNKSCPSICFNQLTYVSCARNNDPSRAHSLKIHWPVLCKYYYDEQFMKRFG